MGVVKIQRETSKPFPISGGLRQCCVIAPNLFNFFFAAALTQALRELPVGVGLSIRINGKLFDSSWSRNAMEALVQELLFAGDAAIVTMSFSLALNEGDQNQNSPCIPSSWQSKSASME